MVLFTDKINNDYFSGDGGPFKNRQLDTQSIKRKITMGGAGDLCITLVVNPYSDIVGISTILNDHGFMVKEFDAPEEGVDEILLYRNADIVIVDLMLPSLSSDLCKRIRERYSMSELPIIVLTEIIDIDETIKVINSGANDILLKPFAPELLLAKVNTFMKLKLLEEKTLDAETDKLQAQINPHFLHNAMNAIASYIYKDADIAYEAVTDLSDYLRDSYNFSSERNDIPLSKSIQMVEKYLKVEALRYGDRLRYEINMENIDTVVLPLFMIQPLVENAIRHGISKKADGGHIKISGQNTGEDYLISVEDDGIGISEEILNCILTGEKSYLMGIGLRNVKQRLKKIYNNELIIESEYGKGTKISFIISSGKAQFP